MRIPSRDELLGTSIADQSTRMQAPLWELRRVMMFNRTTIVIIVSVGEERPVRYERGTMRWPLREKKRASENTASRLLRLDALPTSRFIILRVRHLSHSIVAKRNAVRVSKWLCARRKQSFAIRACSRLRQRRIREGEISEWKNARVNLAEDREKRPWSLEGDEQK